MTADSASLYALPRNLVLAASAGTGKTHALVGVVVHLLVTDRVSGGRRQPLDPSRVVATTFSRKAATEIRVRVTRELERLASSPSTSVYVPSLRASPMSGSLTDEELQRRAGRALSRLGAARFGTLHSFATSIVRAHAVELGLGPGFELASEADSRALAEEAIAHALESRIGPSEAIVRSLAEAAGGVDRLVAQLRRILGRLEEDGRPARELAIDSDDAEKIERDVAHLVAHARDLCGAPKFEAASRDLLRAWQERHEAALEEAAAALCSIPAQGKKSAEVDAFAVFRKGLAGSTNEEKGRRLARVFRARQRFKEHALVVRDVLASAEVEIERASRTRAVIGFGEVLRAARELLRDRPDVAEDVSGAIDALLVDEFQDTSRVQRDLVQLLWARKGTREAGRVPPLSSVRDGGLLVVGDRKQSIYGFRGADVGVFAELAVGLAGAPAREALGIVPGVTWEPPEPLADFFALRHNRRSVAELLTFANTFSTRRFCPGEPPPELYEIDYVPETEDLIVPPERSAQPHAAQLEPRTTWLRVAPKGQASTRLEEALVIAERIGRLVSDPSVLVGHEIGRPALFRDIAVLATTNGMLDAMAFALAQSEIPYVVAGKSFFRTREVRDLASMLALVLDPNDRLAMLSVLRGPWAAVHDETLIGLTARGVGLVAPRVWTSPPYPALVREEDRAALGAVSALLEELTRNAERLGPGEVLRQAVRACSLEEVLALLPRGEQRVANVRKLLAMADHHSDVHAFRSWLEEASEQETAESEAATFSEGDDAVRLLTVHASKGLDFPIVFIPEIGASAPRTEKGVARLSLGTGDAQNVLAVRVADEASMVLEPPSFARAYAETRRRERAERQRLAYVAVTRAANAMFLVGGRTKEGTGDPGSSTLGTLEEIAADGSLLRSAALAIEDVDVPASIVRHHDDLHHEAEASLSPPPTPRRLPVWKSLSIAPTALKDFDHCSRRFELIHLLGLPEYARGTRSSAATPLATTTVATSLDARAQGTLAHAVLERVPLSAFADDNTDIAVSSALVAEGIPTDHPLHASIAARVTRFLRGAFAQSTAAAGAERKREVAFVLVLKGSEGREVILRGSMDLVVVWPNGAVDVIDYKSARSGSEDAYGFQLDVYALAARSLFPSAPSFRVGLIYLGGASASEEPVWRSLPVEANVHKHITELGDRLARARFTREFPRTELRNCERIYCGFIGRCHASTGGSIAESGTDANDPNATTT